MANLKIRNLSNSFGPIRCLDRVNLEVDSGQLAVIVGPSGCGKTTLMRCIVGLERFSEGSVLIDEEVINDKEPKDRDVAMVFQYYALYPHMTVLQNLSLGLKHTTKLTKEDIQKRIDEIAWVLKISKLLARKPGQLSGGESQRVAIGRALVRKPKIFLLDEPLSAVDAKLRRELRTEIRRIQREFGVTTIYVTHDQEEAMAVGDKLVVLRDGRIQQVGTPEEVFNSPRNQFVAGFVGKPPMNFLEVAVERKDSMCLLKHGGFSYEISRGFYEGHVSSYSGKSLILGIRPSSIRIVEKTEAATTRTNSATVSLIENMGDANYVFLGLESNRIIAKTRSVTAPRIGARLAFSFEEEDVHLFDKASGESLRG